MSGFNLPENFHDNPERFVQNVRARSVPPQRTASEKELPATAALPRFRMAEKTLREYAAPSADNVPVGPQVNVGDGDFDLKTSLITMAQASPFCGKLNEDASAHLQQFLEICSTYKVKGVTADAIRL